MRVTLAHETGHPRLSARGSSRAQTRQRDSQLGKVAVLISVFIVAGLTTGSIFALAAIGLVLTYKTSGIFNFAHGSLASLSAFTFYYLRQERGWPWSAAAAVSVIVGGVSIGLLLEYVTRRLASASLSMRVLSTTGILLVVQGGILLVFSPGSERRVQPFLPTASFDVAGVPVTAAQIITFGIGIVLVGALTLFLTMTRTGIAMRGVVEDPTLLDLTGISPVQIRRRAWVIGSMLAAVSGVLLAPLVTLDATTLTFLVVTAFGAAAIGRFTSLPLTFIGGLAIGVGQALLQKYIVSSTGVAGGLAASLPFLVLFVLLIAAPRLPQLSVGTVRSSRSDNWTAPTSARIGGAMLLLLMLLLVPQFVGMHLLDWTRFLAYGILFLSLGLLVRTSGQVSLGHVGFMAVGVTAFAHANERGWPWLVALGFAALIAAPIGAILAIPAIRFPGLYLTLATLGFGLALQQMFYSQSYMFGSGFGLPVARPSWSWLNAQSDRNYYYLVLTIAVVAVLLVVGIERSRLGRLLRAISDSPTGLRASGASINVSRVLVFCISASLASVAGALDGGTTGVVGGDGYPPFVSLQLLVLVLISFGRTPWFAVIAAAGQILIPAYISSSNPDVTSTLTLVFGLSAIALSIAPPEARGIPAPIRRVLDRIRADKTHVERSPVGNEGVASRSAQVSEGGSGLAIEHLSVRYGGAIAADGVNVRASLGKITGLIGPNGAGKSTVFNACSGIVGAASGTVSLNGKDLRRLGQPARARGGLGRTFQQTELFGSLTVAQNVELGAEAQFAGWNPVSHLLTSRRQRHEMRERAAEAMTLCGVAELSGRTVGSLSTGQRRLVELARCLAGTYEVLLLDEPSSGLDRVETERFGKVLEAIVAQRKVGILLVEHDMALINKLCDYVYVIDFGKPIFDGTVAEIRDSPIVRHAYLGGALPDLEDGLQAQGVRG